MPRTPRFTREQVINAAMGIVRKHGMDALTARSLASALNSSVKPIFGLFTNMEDVQQSVWEAAAAEYTERIRRAMTSSEYPPYMASGMAYIYFAKDEPELFKMLFMHDQSDEQRAHMSDQVQPIIKMIAAQLGLDLESATRFHLQMWVYVHGIASMIATKYIEWDQRFIEESVSSMFLALKDRATEKSKGE
ncbi:TetR/AcrR family transcriptional regulator [Bifidobacterium canis]|uniref:TetR family transcriptional regulator n=1 Tax=Bifidobacterium canis TaxID=2610880 RepID=A0A7K1J6X0_9BIFI|nr:TetR-like C-terminal domain-containing protein [Bifidobacterium canis]MUH60200.1 TetR family transcriptional regulator [Bifidobacterium canis]